jgi:hypothetical protein
MAADVKIVHVTKDVTLSQILEEAASEPLLLEHEGVIYRIVREPEAVVAALLQRPEQVAPREGTESLADYFQRVTHAIMRGREFHNDSSDLLEMARHERSTELP